MHSTFTYLSKFSRCLLDIKELDYEDEEMVKKQLLY